MHVWAQFEEIKRNIKRECEWEKRHKSDDETTDWSTPPQWLFMYSLFYLSAILDFSESNENLHTIQPSNLRIRLVSPRLALPCLPSIFIFPFELFVRRDVCMYFYLVILFSILYSLYLCCFSILLVEMME